MFIYPLEYDGDFTVVDIGIIVVVVIKMVVVVVAVVDDGVFVANNSTEDVVDGNSDDDDDDDCDCDKCCDLREALPEVVPDEFTLSEVV